MVPDHVCSSLQLMETQCGHGCLGSVQLNAVICCPLLTERRYMFLSLVWHNDAEQDKVFFFFFFF